LEKIILMIKRQENVIPTLVLEEENTNEDIELHAQIDGGDILNFFYKFIAPPIFSSGEDGWGFSCQIFSCNTC